MNKLMNDVYSQINYCGEKYKTPYRKVFSENSYTLGSACEDKFSLISKIFDLKDAKKKFLEATSGSGKEISRISVMHSSSLLSFVFFYSAIFNGGLTLKVNNQSVKFTKVFFEYKNPVTDKARENHPSNVDCVLTDDGFNHILFIESKFIEPYRDYRLSAQKSDLLSEEYKTISKSSALFNEFYKYVKDNKSHYYYGLKQMITHYSGLVNYVNGNMHSETKSDIEKSSVYYKKNQKVYLMEVVYDLSNADSKYSNILNQYIKEQEKIQEIMKKECDKIIPLGTTTYQNIAEQANININIKKYYGF